MTGAERTQLATELAREWTSRLSAAVEMMAQQPLSAEFTLADADAATPAAGLPSLDYSFSHAAAAPMRVSTPAETSSGIATIVLKASGIEEFDDGLLRETWQEILAQAASGLAQHVGMRIGATVSCANAIEVSGPLAEGVLASIALSMAGTTFEPLIVSFPMPFLDGLQADQQGENAESSEEARSGSVVGHAALPPTLDLLLDVEMPVSVSFGRTFLPIREVLKLATGSIIELDRPVNQHVEVVVNNCVIARGEVVVIEGNYGVRIHEIISRSDRMALQHLTTMNPYLPMRISA